MLSAICETQQQAILSVFAVGYPLIMISGFATPVENMPDWLQTVAEGSPLKHFLVIIQGSFSKAMPPIEIWSNAWPMVVDRTDHADARDGDREAQAAVAVSRALHLD